MPDGATARLVVGGEELYPFVFSGMPEPIGIVASIIQKPFCLRQATDGHGGTRVFADLHRVNEQTDTNLYNIDDGVIFGVHADFRSDDRTTALVIRRSFLDHRLFAIWCALS